VAQWSLGRAFLPMKEPITLAAGKSFDYVTQWRQLDQNDEPVPPGRYELIATQTTKQDPTTLTLALYRGVLAAYPDNTFRPKADLTRIDLGGVFVGRWDWGGGLSRPPGWSDGARFRPARAARWAWPSERGLLPARA